MSAAGDDEVAVDAAQSSAPRRRLTTTGSPPAQLADDTVTGSSHIQPLVPATRSEPESVRITVHDDDDTDGGAQADSNNGAPSWYRAPPDGNAAASESIWHRTMRQPSYTEQIPIDTITTDDSDTAGTNDTSESDRTQLVWLSSSCASGRIQMSQRAISVEEGHAEFMRCRSVADSFVLLRVLSYLDAVSLARVAAVDTRMREASTTRALWVMLLRQVLTDRSPQHILVEPDTDLRLTLKQMYLNHLGLYEVHVAEYDTRANLVILHVAYDQWATILIGLLLPLAVSLLTYELMTSPDARITMRSTAPFIAALVLLLVGVTLHVIGRIQWLVIRHRFSQRMASVAEMKRRDVWELSEGGQNRYGFAFRIIIFVFERLPTFCSGRYHEVMVCAHVVAYFVCFYNITCLIRLANCLADPWHWGLLEPTDWVVLWTAPMVYFGEVARVRLERVRTCPAYLCEVLSMPLVLQLLCVTLHTIFWMRLSQYLDVNLRIDEIPVKSSATPSLHECVAWLICVEAIVIAYTLYLAAPIMRLILQRREARTWLHRGGRNADASNAHASVQYAMLNSEVMSDALPSQLSAPLIARRGRGEFESSEEFDTVDQVLPPAMPTTTTVPVIAVEPGPSPSTANVHHDVICDGCSTYPIVGDRYQCTHPACLAVSSFEYCTVCYQRDPKSHGHGAHGHVFIRWSQPEPQPMPPVQDPWPSPEEMQVRLTAWTVGVLTALIVSEWLLAVRVDRQREVPWLLILLPVHAVMVALLYRTWQVARSLFRSGDLFILCGRGREYEAIRWWQTFVRRNCEQPLLRYVAWPINFPPAPTAPSTTTPSLAQGECV